jgi:hypothetical protein
VGHRRRSKMEVADRACSRCGHRDALNARDPVPLPSGRQPGPLPRALALGRSIMHSPAVVDNECQSTGLGM